MQAFAELIAEALYKKLKEDPISNLSVGENCKQNLPFDMYKFLNFEFGLPVRDEKNNKCIRRSSLTAFMGKTISEIVYLRHAVEQILCIEEDIYQNLTGIPYDEDLPDTWPLLRDIIELRIKKYYRRRKKKTKEESESDDDEQE